VIRALFHPGRVQKQHERVVKAMKAHARAAGDAVFERTMADFYTQRVLAIDPHVDWNGFAEVKQKQVDHQTDCLAYEKRAEIALAKLRAEEERYAKLRQAG